MEKASVPSAALGRRDFLHRGLAGGAALAAAPALLDMLPGSAEAQTSSWRGVVGCIKPTLRPGTLEELIRMLPVGIGVLPVYLEFHEGTAQEFRKGVDQYEHYVEFLAKHNCDIIHPEGAPPFMVLGRAGETKLTDSWAQKYGKPVFTASQNQVNALHALGAKSLYGATYFPDPKINQFYAKYFEDAGFKVFGMEGLKGIDFGKVQDVSSQEIYAFIKKGFLANPGGDAIYMLGSAWRTLDIIEPLEQDLGVPVVHAEVARAWEIQKRLHVNQPFKGYGRLLETLPPLKV